MAREKRLKPLTKYLRAIEAPPSREDDAAAVIGMFEDLAASGANVQIRRVDRSQ